MSTSWIPSIAPGVGTAVPGGPTYREAQLCMEMIADTRLVARSTSWSSIRPSTCATETAVLAVDLLESLFGKSTLVRRPVWPTPGRGADHRARRAACSFRPAFLKPQAAAAWARVGRHSRRRIRSAASGQ